MPTDDALLFIDANKYLDLYRIKKGKLILAALSQQADRIFVTQKVVDEVKRHKIKETASFLARDFKELSEAENFQVPDHLFGISEDQSRSIQRQMGEIRQKIKQVNKELRALAAEIMTKVGQSADEVSIALAPIFAKAMGHSDAQLQNARERKERGDPPGKPTDPLGDQVTWQQILDQFVGKTKLWIITRDSDYGSMYGGKGFLNQFLYDELLTVSPSAEVFLFENLPDGIKHFADTTGVSADKLPTLEEIEEIKEEERALTAGTGVLPGFAPGAFGYGQGSRAFGYFLPLEQGGGGFMGTSSSTYTSPAGGATKLFHPSAVGDQLVALDTRAAVKIDLPSSPEG